MWEILGIEPTVNIKDIKKAYAKMVTIYHPEDYPEEFQRLQMSMGKGGNVCYNDIIMY